MANVSLFTVYLWHDSMTCTSVLFRFHEKKKKPTSFVPGNGLQGFQTPIANDSFIVDGVGAFGSMHSERGLTYYEVDLSGHMVPQFSPVVSVFFFREGGRASQSLFVVPTRSWAVGL